MTAGKGISHSERESQEARTHERTIHGLQFWVALPKEKEDMNPSFEHYKNSAIPKHLTESAEVTVIAGTAFGKTSPLTGHSPMVLMIIEAKTQGKFDLPSDGHELALYVVKGSVKIDAETYSANKMVVFKNRSDLSIYHSADALFAVIGGEPLPEERYIWWNLVSSSQDKIEAAKKSWEDNSFPQVPNEDEKIPLPAV